jgi:hypothetical protein
MSNFNNLISLKPDQRSKEQPKRWECALQDNSGRGTIASSESTLDRLALASLDIAEVNSSSPKAIV